MKGCNNFSVLFVLTNSALNRGMNTGLENLAWGLAESGVNVHVLSGGEEPRNHGYVFPPTIRYHFTGSPGENPANFLPIFKKLLQEKKIDAVVGWIVNISLLATLPNSTRVVFVANQGQIAPRYIMLRYLKKTLLRQISTIDLLKIFFSIRSFSIRADAIISISDAVMRSCLNTYRLNKTKCRVVPRGVDTEIFSFRKVKPIVEEPKLLYAGNIQPAKGINDLIEALGFIDYPVQLVLCGKSDEDYIRHLESTIKAQSKNHTLIYTGPQAQRDLVKYYQACDIFVFPSHAEGLGKVLLEAMSCGCPVVCSDIDTFKEVVNHGHNALIAPVKSPIGLAEEINHFLEDETLRQECGRNARCTVEKHFSKAAEIEAWCRVLSNIAQSNKVYS